MGCRVPLELLWVEDLLLVYQVHYFYFKVVLLLSGEVGAGGVDENVHSSN